MKRKKWQLFLILAVGALTLFNILPTVLYYLKPLDEPVDSRQALGIARDITERVSRLEDRACAFLGSAAKLLNVKPIDITVGQSGNIRVKFKNADEAWRYAGSLFRSGSTIVFAPEKLHVEGVEKEGDCSVVTVRRSIRTGSSSAEVIKYFGFAKRRGEDGRWTPAMRQLVWDRIAHVVQQLGSSSKAAFLLQVASQNDEVQPICLDIARSIVEFATTYGVDGEPARRYFSSFSNGMNGSSKAFLKAAFEKQKGSVTTRIARLKKKQPEGYEARVAQLESKRLQLSEALSIVDQAGPAFDAKRVPFSKQQIIQVLSEQGKGPTYSFDLGGRDPFIAAVSVDEKNSQLQFILHKDVENKALPSQIINHLSRIAQASGEAIQVQEGKYVAPLHELKDASSFLTLDLRQLMQARVNVALSDLKERFKGEHEKLKGCEILSYGSFIKLEHPEAFKGLVVCAPVLHDEQLPMSLDRTSIYIMARGVEEAAKTPGEELKKDIGALRQILYVGANGYDYPSALIPLPEIFHGDYFFEIKNPLDAWLQGSREKWRVLGSKRVAVLELSTQGQRIDEINRIESAEHEDLLRWRDDYRAAQVDLNPSVKASVPAPTQSPLWSNFKLSCKKYFRGDPRRVLKWGLDLSGGKTVHIQLLDRAGRLVSNPEDLAQATSELYMRANRLGISEVAVRSEGNYIVMDFPGSQNLSARELVTGSSMAFHIVNEKFSPANQKLGEAVSQFLAQVWNEAEMQGKTEAGAVEQIAIELLERGKSEVGSSAKVLWESGLRLSLPDYFPTCNFDTSLSKIVRIRGSERAQWFGQNHPLMVVYSNFALEGSSLGDVHAGYDAEKGNYLSFKVLSERAVHGLGEIHPQAALGAWTGQFSKSAIASQPLGEETPGRGWRMAVVLNNEIISAPHLESAIQDSGMITGNFTQREVGRLESDLRAGSLSFTPKILSESNISPELGMSERLRSISAMVLSLFAVMLVMVAVYRFGGFVASGCVIFNIFIMWAIFQSLGVVLSLATIAGVVLTIGMSVDANVLVFERIREEYAKSNNLKYALSAGYRMAFSAILDSNLTTIVAALILLNFDSGPIKGFALTMVVGIVSSMFTALFVTRYFFSIWVENPRHTALNMRPLFSRVRWDFFKGARVYACVAAIVLGLGSWAAFSQGRQLLGMDFTGGYALSLNLAPQQGDLKGEVEKALLASGLSHGDMRLRTLEKSHNIKLMLTSDLGGRIPALADAKSPAEKVAWILEQLKKQGVALDSKTAFTAEQSWVEMSSELSDAMTSQALIGLALALGAILIYISWRFEPKGALAAVVCLIHDVIITLSVLVMLRYVGLDLQIDLHTIAALMTIVGYSLNDTIIIFDRVREQKQLNIKGSLREQLNMALRATLSRTTMTSFTTLVVLVFLMSSRGGVIFGFACVMTTGVVFGTLSSLFLAAPLWVWLGSLGKKNPQLA